MTVRMEEAPRGPRPIATPVWARRAAIALGVAAVAALVLWILSPIVHVALVAFAGLLLAAFLRGTGGRISRHLPISVRAAVALTCFVLVGFCVTVAVLAAPEIGRQAEALAKELPEAARRAVDTIRASPVGAAVVDRLQSAELPGPRRALGVFSTLSGALGGALVLLFVGVYVAFDPGPYERGLVRLVPPLYRDHARDVLHDVAHALASWTFGRCASAAVIGVGTWLGLTILGLPLAAALALVAAVLTFVPNFGPIVAVVPALLLAMLEGRTTVAWVLALYGGLQLVESYAVTPLIQRRAVNVPPALLVTAQVTMGAVAGVIGIAVATPLLAVAIVVVRRLYVEDVLEDRDPSPRERSPDGSSGIRRA